MASPLARALGLKGKSKPAASSKRAGRGDGSLRDHLKASNSLKMYVVDLSEEELLQPERKLVRAVLDGEEEQVHKQVEDGAKVTVPVTMNEDSGVKRVNSITALHAAISHASDDMVRFVLASVPAGERPPILMMDTYGVCPLETAVLHARGDMLALMLDKLDEEELEDVRMGETSGCVIRAMEHIAMSREGDWKACLTQLIHLGMQVPPKLHATLEEHWPDMPEDLHVAMEFSRVDEERVGRMRKRSVDKLEPCDWLDHSDAAGESRAKVEADAKMASEGKDEDEGGKVSESKMHD